MGFPRQECWSGLPFLSLGDLPDPGIEPVSPALVGGFFTSIATREAHARWVLGLSPLGQPLVYITSDVSGFISTDDEAKVTQNIILFALTAREFRVKWALSILLILGGCSAARSLAL